MLKTVKKYQENIYCLTEDEARKAIVAYMNDTHTVIEDGKDKKTTHVFVTNECVLDFKGDSSWYLKVIDRVEVRK